MYLDKPKEKDKSSDRAQYSFNSGNIWKPKI